VTIEIRILGPNDGPVLRRLADEVFDHPVNPAWSTEFLKDSRHHLVVALDENLVVGFASGVHYVHPDKAAQLFINEVGVAPSHQGGGIGKSLVSALLEVGRGLGCYEAWVLTEPDNTPARRLYESLGGLEEDQHFVEYVFPLKPGPA